MGLGCAADEATEPEDAPACEELDSVTCEERRDCALTDVAVVRRDEDGACEWVEEHSECLERMTLTAGCAGGVCNGSDPAPWYEERADSGTAIAHVGLCGVGFEGWRECQATEDGPSPPICACACEM